MKNTVLTILAFLFTQQAARAQQPLVLTVDSLFSLAEANSKQLDISRYKIDMAENAAAIEKQKASLPELESDFSYAYLSNAAVWDNNFRYDNTARMPHTSLDLSVAASYLVFAGKSVKNSIEKAGLEAQVAQLDFRKDKEDIQFLLLAKYLDLAALHNQEKVVLENIALAEQQLSHIEKLIEQGMRTHNDRVRSELLLTELKEKLSGVRNDMTIVNHDLNVITGLAQETVIMPDTAVLTGDIPVGPIDRYRTGYTDRLPELKAAGVNSEIAEKQLDIVKSRRLPSVSLFAGSAVSRPFLYAMPPVDIYMHLFQTGVKVHYDIGSTYKNKKLEQQALMEETLSKKNELLIAEKAEMEIHTAYVKLQDAQEKYHSQTESFRLAKDNYRVVQQKYLNKFAVITDMVDASNSLLSAQINMNNARIGIIYQYYHLMKASGQWDAAVESLSLNKQ